MIDSVPGLGACKRMASTLTLAALAVTLAGCGSGSGGGPGANPANFGVFQPDRHGNTPASATRLYPDNGSITAAINSPGDQDWFKFQGVAGVIYVTQVSGFSVQFPDMANPNNNNTFDFSIFESYFQPDGLTQLQSTTGNTEGAPFDINVAGINDTNIIGDSRILMFPDTNGTYYIRMLHNRVNGIGNYHINVASSHFGQTQDINFSPTHWRPIIIPGEEDGDPPFFVNQYVQMFTGPFNWDLTNPGDIFFFGFGGDLVNLIEEGEVEGTFVFEEDPQTRAIHLHIGYPNILVGGAADNFTTPVDPPHTIAFDLTSVVARREGIATEAIYTSQDGRQARLPVNAIDGKTTPDGKQMFGIDFRHAIARQGSDVPLEAFRAVIGWPVYADAHFTDDLDLASTPISTSGHLLNAYSIFETPLLATPANLTREQLDELPEKYIRLWEDEIEQDTEYTGTLRALGVERQYTASAVIRYDAALQAFTLVDRVYDAGIRPNNPGFPLISEPITNQNRPPQLVPAVLSLELPGDFVGLRIDVHRGPPGINGPLLMALGTIPEPKLPPGIFAVAGNFPVQFPTIVDPSVAYYDDFFADRIFRSDGAYDNRTIIKKLTDAEAAILRRAYYHEGGFHILIKDQKIPGSPAIARAEGFIGIQFFPNDPPPLQTRADGTVVDNHGTVRFATTYAGGSVTVIANGEILGDLVTPVDGEAPACGDDPPGSVIATQLLPDEYYYRAFAEDGTEWDGIFTVDGMGSCNTILLAPN